MNCQDVDRLLDPWMDDELDGVEMTTIAQHVEGCARCSDVVERRRALRDAVRSGLEWKEAPDILRASITRSAKRPPLWRRPVTALASTAALLAITAIGSWQIGNRSARANALNDEVMTSHVRSLMGTHLTDVVSTDQHTVKPWFNGRIDYSPPVSDFVGKGYPLQGGRLDYVDGRSVAVLVYGRRKHEINLYLWPASGSSAPVKTSSRGYNMVRWTESGYSCWAVSDLGKAELNDFAELVRAAMKQ